MTNKIKMPPPFTKVKTFNGKEPRRYGLYFRWSVSRGRESYGYNICSLLINGKKVASCNGGGYDMKGTSFAQWIQHEFQTELVEIGMQAGNLYPCDEKGRLQHEKQSLVDKLPKGHFYGMYAYIDFDEKKRPVVKKVSLDGACGFSSIERIVEAIGYKVDYVSEVDNGGSVYIIKNY